ncbi:ASST-domain-containing protein [Mycena filopes]|nr:ASST-domain-containing protein [Mycena filopes]
MRSTAQSALLSALAACLLSSVDALYETTYKSSPLVIQPFTILERSASYDPDNSTLFLVCPVGPDVAQPGPAIYSSTGELVWADPSLVNCNNLNLQTFDGEQYLTMWIGVGEAATGQQQGSGVGILLNSAYELVQNVSVVSPGGTDLHEFQIPQPTAKTALLTAYNPIPLDLTSVGGSKNGWYLNSVFQEVDIASGRVLFNWASVDHIALDESFNNLTLTASGDSETNPWDPVHINSLDKDSAGNYLVSARNCGTLYKLAANGTIIWRLGGKRSDFTALGDDAEFHWQHHVRWRNNETQISVFDDGAAVLLATEVIDEPIASGKYLNVDQSAMTVSLDKRYLPSPSTGFSLAAGSVEPHGSTVVVSYGSNPWVTVHDADSQAVLLSAVLGPTNVSLPLGAISTYRVFATSTHAFVGRPRKPPSVAVEDGAVYVSWNGATQVARYELFTGNQTGSVGTKVRGVKKAGFETNMGAAGGGAYVAVEALAANGTVLGRSAVYRTSDGSVV